ncbi:hypothetical protein [Myxococcus virescens]|uniref:Uncharacterized protein n=1 Tax=Myxococcus virescens TaxID=83456 RepID=A0A511H4T7_9BACT|nr:hypothetical protein [Myxococcus virescens]GEL68394.1 hypothetical protein MVI01_01780 [Myxococcus virescens]SDE28158.1 hypothetical protein SAMN04488504_105406 [Myxococcus virescens]
MPVVTVRAGNKQRPGRFDVLVRKTTEKVSDLLEESDRVLVVYEQGCASLYYEREGDMPHAPTVNRPS